MRRAILAAVVIVACNAVAPAAASDREYVVNPPDGKLPWPHHRPDLDAAGYGRLMNDLYIINNYGQYQQGQDSFSDAYYHDGLDVVIPNGTPIYAIAGGTVRAIVGSAPDYESLVIEDRDQPGWAWSYTHVSRFRVKVGDVVGKGQELAEISFQGVPHTHLSRIYLVPNGRWTNFNHWVHVQPDGFFDFPDEDPPVVETPFHYAGAGTTRLFPEGSPTRVSDAVDIVVGMRDAGAWARSRGIAGMPIGYGDRHAITRVEVEIRDARRRVVLAWPSFDFSRIHLHRPSGLRDIARVSVVYFPFQAVRPGTVRDWNRIPAYYVVTNADGSGEWPLLEPDMGRFAWDTREVPDGDYLVTVTAYDSKGNRAQASDWVFVDNGR